MPIPTLDPSRFFAAVLADPSHRLPLPGAGAVRFFTDGAVIDSADPFFAHLLADGSLKRQPVTQGEPAEKDGPAEEPAPPPPEADPAA